jgi:hypothetical protein
VHFRRFSLVSELLFIDNRVTGDTGNLFAFPILLPFFASMYYAKTEKSSNISVTMDLLGNMGAASSTANYQKAAAAV